MKSGSTTVDPAASIEDAPGANREKDLALANRGLAPLEAALRIESGSLAYLLGAWAAHSRVGTEPDRRLSFTSQSRLQLVPLQRAWRDFLGETPAIERARIGDAPCHRILVFSEPLTRHVHTVTANNSTLPWEHLGTREEQRRFLRGFFHYGGWLTTGTSPCIGIHKWEGKELLREVAVLMSRFGIYPLVSDLPYASLRLKERQEWIKFRSEIGYQRADARAELAALCRMRNTKRSYTVDEYRDVMELAALSQTPSAIARGSGVPANTVRDWIYRGRVPKVVIRHDLIREWAAKIPDPETAAFVYRELHGSADVARRVALRWPFDDLKHRIRTNHISIRALCGKDDLIDAVFSRHTESGKVLPQHP